MRILKAKIKKILLIRFRMLGDVMLTTPAVTALSTAFPKATITYCTGRKAKEVLEHNPHIDNFLLYHPALLREIIQLPPFDLAINFEKDEFSGMVCFLSRARYRVGFRRNVSFPRIRQDIYTMVPARAKNRSDALHSFMSLLKASGIRAVSRKTRMYLTRKELAFANAYFKRRGIEARGLIGVQPVKDDHQCPWGEENFRALIHRLLQEFPDLSVAVFQGPASGENRIIERIYRSVRLPKRCIRIPPLPLRKYASLLQKCSVLVAHDGGPLHFAAGLGVRTVGIFGPRDSAYWYPYKKKEGHLLFKKEDIRSIAVEDVARAIRTLL